MYIERERGKRKINMRRPSLICSISKQAEGAVVKGTSKGVGVKRGPWTVEEDEILMDYVKREGEGKWRTMPNKAGLLRCGKSCRLRWMNYLRPSLKRGNITPDEEDLILRLHRLLGNRWSLIAGRIPGRTDNEIKNYWNTHLSKKLISKGIDPTTHKPLNPIHINYNLSASINENNIARCSSFSEEEAIQLYPNDHLPSSFNENNGFNNIQDDHKNIECSAEDVAAADSKVVLRSNNCIEGLIKSHDNYGEDEDIDIHCCGDESISLFLNSLINEDMFGNPLQEQEQEQEEQLRPPLPELDLMYSDFELDDSLSTMPKSAAGDIITPNSVNGQD